VSAPDPGDRGHIGYPSLEEGRTGGLVSFEYIYRGYLALGVRLLVLDQIRAFLVEHAAHPVLLEYDGEPVAAAAPPAARRVRAMRLDAKRYQHLNLEWSCAACREAVRTARAEMALPCDERLGVARVRKFKMRVLDVSSDNFYRTFDLLDPGGEGRPGALEPIGRFLAQHEGHSLRVRSLGGEQWVGAPLASSARETPDEHVQAGTPSRVLPRASLGPPFKLAWRYESGRRPLVRVKDGVVYTLAPEQRTVVALGREGRELWRTSALGDGQSPVEEVMVGDDVLWISIQDESTATYDIWSVARATGRAVKAMDGAPALGVMLSDGDFVGRLYHPHGQAVESVSRFVVRPEPRILWRLEVPSVPLPPGVLGGAIACEAGRVFVTKGAVVLALDANTGLELWRGDLLWHSRPHGVGRKLSITVAGPHVVYGLADTLHMLSAETGDLLWSRKGFEVTRPRVHYGDTVFLNGSSDSTDSHCLSLSIADGGERPRAQNDSDAWRATPQPAPSFTTLPRPTEDWIYLGDSSGRLWALSSTSGDPVWMQTLEGCTSFLSDLVIADDRLFASEVEGTIHCLVPA
jgi:outer membrane protein assembly factor BamB